MKYFSKLFLFIFVCNFINFSFFNATTKETEELITKSSDQNLIKVKNKSNIPVYVAAYYQKRFLGFKCDRYTDFFCIDAKNFLEIERPPFNILYDRKLLFSENKDDLKLSLSEMEYELNTKLSIGRTKGDTFYIIKKDNVLHGYNYIKWNIIKPSLDFLDNSLDSLLEDASKFIFKHDFSKKDACVRNNNKLCHDEIEFLINRKKRVKKGLEKLLGTKLDLKDDELPNIGFCLSGGGYRAAIAGIGHLLAADKIGLFDSASYITLLSGSSLIMAPLTSLGCSLQNYRDILAKKVSKNLFDFPINIKALTEVLLKKVLLKQKISLIDIFGFLLGEKFFSEFGKQKHSIGLSYTSKFVKSGKYPFPIYTAVNAFENNYQWLEFNPYEIGGAYFESYIPSWSFGRKFVNGKSVDYNPEQGFSYLLGIWLSSFAISCEDILIHIKNMLIRKDLFGFLEEFLDFTELDELRFSPAEVYNFTYGMLNKIMHNIENLTLVDGGFGINGPIVPLLNPERKLDLIIVGDYGDLNEPSFVFKQMADYAERNNLKFPEIDFSSSEYLNINKNVITIFKDEKNVNAPVVIYLPLIKNDSYSKSFDPKNAKYCETLNFEYNKTQFNELSGLTEFGLLEFKDKIINEIKEIINKKKKTTN